MGRSLSWYSFTAEIVEEASGVRVYTIRKLRGRSGALYVAVRAPQ